MIKFKPSPLSFFAALINAEAISVGLPSLGRDYIAKTLDLEYCARRQAQYQETPRQRETRRKRENRQRRSAERRSFRIAQSHYGDCYCIHCSQ